MSIASAILSASLYVTGIETFGIIPLLDCLAALSAIEFQRFVLETAFLLSSLTMHLLVNTGTISYAPSSVSYTHLLKCSHVHSDLFQSSQWNNLYSCTITHIFYFSS